MKSLRNKYKANPEEKVMIETEARFFSTAGESKGNLILTEKKILFIKKSGSIEQEINLSEIKSIKLFKIWGIVSKGFFLLNNKNTVSKVLVDYPKDWIKLIEHQLNLINS